MSIDTKTHPNSTEVAKTDNKGILLDSFDNNNRLDIRDEDNSYKDIPFTILFFTVFIGYCVLYVSVIGDFILPSAYPLPSSPNTPTPPESPFQFLPFATDASPVYSVFFIVILSCFITISIIFLTLFNLHSNYELFIQSAFILNTLIFFSFSILSFVYSYTLYGIISLLVGLTCLLYLKDSKIRFKRSGTLLSIIISIIKVDTSYSYVALIGTFACLFFNITWIVLLSNIYSKWDYEINYRDGSFSDPLMISTVIFVVFSGMYISEVIKNITMVTLSSLYGSWYFSNKRESPLSSMRKSLSFKLGPISFGSLLVSALEFLNQGLDLLRILNSDDSFMRLILTILKTILSVFESLLRYFNHYVFTYVGIFGGSFLDSSKKIFKIFQHNGWSLIVNDCIVNTTLQMYSLIVGLLSSLVCYIYLIIQKPSFNSDGQFTILYPVLGFLISAQITSLIYTIILAGSNSLLISISMHPEILYEKNFEAYDIFAEIWPQILQNHNSEPTTSANTNIELV